ncbi:MAG TPA: DEAD/DEAH box helicase [Acidimicrobiales bacterium]|nr:DEAD/DEAH box helicase [Acidimicrobiales bacterium]
MTDVLPAPGGPAPGSPEALFHPAVASWFARRFPAGPTPPQSGAWPAIAAGSDVLVASPTGSGKTLTGFLVAIDAAYRAAEAGERTGGAPEVLYVSPLRALAVDVHENLHIPLGEIREEAARLGYPDPGLRVAVRTGDTPPAERVAMRKNSPDLLVTTPESLYLLLTAPSSRALLRGVRTVIIDEVHTLARDKRGSHLALSLERLDALVSESGGHLQRIGLSATQRPLDMVARLLSGVHDDRPPTVIVDCGHARDLDVAIELPSTELEAVMSGGQMSDILDRIAEHTRDHRTTLIFVNTRKMAERVAHQLAERLAADEPGQGGDVDESLLVAAHHGSLSAARRRIVETRLRSGDLRALVATASLELGIDVGPVELVCQIGSPRAIGTFLQRVGRANHHRDGTPAGRLYPTTRDELVECTALLAAVREGRLDLLQPPVAPLDVLAQQLVAEVASTDERDVDALWSMTTQAAPYAGLSREDFDQVVALVSWGIETGRGRRGAHLHHDAVNGRLRARRGARLAALTGGGAIPETGDYRVVLDPDGVTVGSVHEDFAVEATAGDIFLLGTHSWRVAKVEVGTVRVHDAGDLPPTIPFWLGEAPARTAELSEAVSDLRAALEPLLADGDGDGARRYLREHAGVSVEVAQQVVAYCAAGLQALGHLPTRDRIVVERCLDDSEGSQLIIHAPFGGRINRALGLALRKRFCVSFDFELQAAADDDTVVLSLGPQHSFPLTRVQSMLSSAKAPEVLTQAVLLHPMLGARWRWNLTRALVLPRMNGGKRRPIHLQRMEADDLLAAVWPGLAACQENAPPGPVGVPDHVLARQTVDDCLHEGLSVEGLVDVWSKVESGAIAVHTVESSEPSPFSHAILSGRPYTYLDDAPLEERRTRALSLRRGLGQLGPDGLPVPVDEMAPLDPDAVAMVLDQVNPRPRDADELHDLLLSLVAARPVDAWARWFDDLAADGRAARRDGCWVATERQDSAAALGHDDDAAAACVAGHLQLAGPVTVADLVADAPLPAGAPNGAPLGEARARTALARLEARGAAIELPDGRWCARNLLARLHGASRSRRRGMVDPVPIADYVRFLTRWQHATPAHRVQGRAGLLEVLEQLQGIEAPASEWEAQILPARVEGYDPRWLDELCLSGEIAWARLTPRPERTGRSGTPSPATPLAFVVRDDLVPMLRAVRAGASAPEPDVGAPADVLAALRTRGACFRPELAPLTGRLPAEVDEGLWDLVARGLVTADAFSAVRSLLSARDRWRTRTVRRPSGRVASGRPASSRLARRRAPAGSGIGEGRWSLLPGPEVLGVPAVDDGVLTPGNEELAETVACQLLARWGVVAWELWSRESFKVPWREVVWALRRLEARGVALGGRFVAGLSGEQYALPEAFEELREVHRLRADGEEVVVAGADPLNMTGSIIGGTRVPTRRHQRVVYRDGVVVERLEAG